MNLIAYVDKINPGLLIGKGLGVKIEPIELEEFMKGMGASNFRGAYVTFQSHLEFLANEIHSNTLKKVTVVKTAFVWNTIHSAVYYAELIPDLAKPIAYYKITCIEPTLQEHYN